MRAIPCLALGLGDVVDRALAARAINRSTSVHWIVGFSNGRRDGRWKGFSNFEETFLVAMRIPTTQQAFA